MQADCWSARQIQSHTVLCVYVRGHVQVIGRPRRQAQASETVRARAGENTHKKTLAAEISPKRVPIFTEEFCYV